MGALPASTIRLHSGAPLTEQIARSARARDGLDGMAPFWSWYADRSERVVHRTERIPLDALEGWERDPATGTIAHRTGGFFTVEGLAVHIPGAPVPRWHQPIVNQPEVGILGFLTKEFHGTLHCLVQAKFEPGNPGGLQLSPTVQATRSNYTRLHGGKAVPYLEHFRDVTGRRVVADVLQSEQGSWFYRKRNRNMIVQVDGDVPPHQDFHWLTIGQLHQLLGVENLVNMDARTVLACMPFASQGPHPLADVEPAGADAAFHRSVVRSCAASEGSLHSTVDIVSWIADLRSRTEVHTRPAALNALPLWLERDGVIAHESKHFLEVMGVDVTAASREVSGWCQPMIEPTDQGVTAFLTRKLDGVLHILAHARVEPGYVDIVEIAPTVQCTPASLETLPPEARPRFLDAVLEAPPERVRYATALSEEGGRFYRAVNTYMIVEADQDIPDGGDYRWMTLHQFTDLLRHSHYVNIQARTLIACLHSLSLGAPSTRSAAPSAPSRK
ncbi:NDP-hexose 2,3-dehydratase family protein [Streptomyces sp. CA-278952]|uniref:NDP-hexose 2,3-dehydratase family protein n=1 Tax=unclassified Streptomyces TaxID=2593676 RepID=UPI002241F8BD|nr:MULTISPECIES: NDP-hexose 2,3-dehydratase family protein [unclassified Streptomyces]UZI28589.1 NDP-hexose 2,3-dehydratase family protein [Streptomyces sp. VB1]WDG28527.1 NDP-hexose 2,3-dehydratase family protein [Streptomyces sp. CA-278952]